MRAGSAHTKERSRARGDATPPVQTAVGLSRRRDRPLSARERRDVRWALNLDPGTHAHGIDVHGVYITFRHAGRSELAQPTRQQSAELDRGAKRDNADKPKRRRRESEARKAAKDERWQAKVLKRKLLAVLPLVGEWARRQTQQVGEHAPPPPPPPPPPPQHTGGDPGGDIDDPMDDERAPKRPHDSASETSANRRSRRASAKLERVRSKGAGGPAPRP